MDRISLGWTGMNDASQREPPRQPPRIVSPAFLVGKPPDREWIVRNWVPCEVVTGLYGEGGIGKSLLLQQLQTSTALGAQWLGLATERVASLCVYCEDPEAELWRRQDDICASYAAERTDLDEAHWMIRFGEDNALMVFTSRGLSELTPFHKEVIEAARDLEVRLVGIDTASDTFPGNENDRSQVRQYVQRALGSIAIAIRGAVVANAHPSRAGLNSGEGDSGSTGWSNSFRSRLFVRYPEIEKGEHLDPTARILQRRKANYADARDEIQLQWRLGAFEAAKTLAPGSTTFGVIDAETTFLDLLGEFEVSGRVVSESAHASNYAPRMFGRVPRDQRRGYREGDFLKAMNVLFARHAIASIDYGRRSDSRKKIVVTPM
jgi:RecA-family ATPase